MSRPGRLLVAATVAVLPLLVAAPASAEEAPVQVTGFSTVDVGAAGSAVVCPTGSTAVTGTGYQGGSACSVSGTGVAAFGFSVGPTTPAAYLHRVRPVITTATAARTLYASVTPFGASLDSAPLRATQLPAAAAAVNRVAIALTDQRDLGGGTLSFTVHLTVGTTTAGAAVVVDAFEVSRLAYPQARVQANAGEPLLTNDADGTTITTSEPLEVEWSAAQPVTLPTPVPVDVVDRAGRLLGQITNPDSRPVNTDAAATQTAACGASDDPCVTEWTPATVAAVGVPALALVLIGGARLAQGFRR